LREHSHGYLPFNKETDQFQPFKPYNNTASMFSGLIEKGEKVRNV
jgi:hypothetical protein